MACMLDKMHDYKIISVADNGNSKKFRVSAKTYDEKEFVFDFTMEKKNDYWKITKLNNIGEICSVFEEFAKESLVNYFKDTQNIENDYKDKSREDFKITKYTDYCEARMNAEHEYMGKLFDFPTNPFSDIVNNHRIMRSHNAYNFYELALKMETDKTKSKNADLIAEKKKYLDETNNYRKKVDSIMKSVGYENK